VTSYNEIESDEDQDAMISGMGYPEAWWTDGPGWDIEENPNPAATTRPGCKGTDANNDKPQLLREQWYWWCVVPPED